ncbi:MAG: hypothetical protein JOZ84_15215 [Methylobacteriaceae bacterium]|nr:hypothetical protein [Methylobacteriaceae bacterium]
MKRNLSVAVAMIATAWAFPAWADGKCGNGGGHRLFQLSKNEFVIPWAIPVPRNAKVQFVQGGMIEAIAPHVGSEIPGGFPEKYNRDVKRVEIFNSTMAWDVQQLLETEKRFGIEMSKDAVGVFEAYAKSGEDFVVGLLQHPQLGGSGDVAVRCSVVLQRGVIEYIDGRETLHLSSRLHSTSDSGQSVNFVPQETAKISFESSTIWFPLSLTQLIGEPASYVVLDVVTQKAFKPAELPQEFQAEESKRIDLHGKSVYATRISAKLDAGRPIADLKLKP